MLSLRAWQSLQHQYYTNRLPAITELKKNKVVHCNMHKDIEFRELNEPESPCEDLSLLNTGNHHQLVLREDICDLFWLYIKTMP